uniref:phospholipase A2 n=1 Tax=Paramormyrops kingsleyae TaxID=1676925 RepID=A0A3B3QLY7_9TELE
MTNSAQLYVVSLLVVLVFLQKYDAATSSKMDRDTINFCFWKSSAAHGARYSFLRESAGVHAVRSLQLYQSTWTEEQRLVECVLSDHPSVTGSYMSLCRGDLADEFSDETDDRFNISQLLIPGGPCVTLPADDPLDVQVTPSPTAPTLRRHKRSWIFPGTLWCGTGSKAMDYGDLGVFNQTDQCCREHDHCEHTIAPFRVNFGVFNHHFFTVSHCNCDRRFRQCLLEVNDTVSHMVGFSFFSMLKVPCFRLTRKPYCTQLSWWGVLKLLNQPTTKPRKTSGTKKNPYKSISPTKTSQILRSKQKKTPSSNKASPLASSKDKPSKKMSVAPNTTSQLRSSRTNIPKNFLPTKNSTIRKLLMLCVADRLQLCEYYRSLEECRYKILPQERQYRLFNAEAKVLYHCNCRCITPDPQGAPSAGHSWSLGARASAMKCFVIIYLFSPSCPASLSQVEKLKLTLDTKKHKQGEKSLEEAAPTVKKDKIRKSLRRSVSIRLHNKCLRITDFNE